MITKIEKGAIVCHGAVMCSAYLEITLRAIAALNRNIYSIWLKNGKPSILGVHVEIDCDGCVNSGKILGLVLLVLTHKCPIYLL